MFTTYLEAITFGDVLDVVMLTVLVYALLLWFKKARAAFVVKGMIVTAGVYLVARLAGMVMVTTVFHAFFAILAVALVVIFQEELRRLFERIAVWSLSSTNIRVAQPRHDHDAVLDRIVRTAFELAAGRIGALIVMVGRDPLDRHLEGGWKLGGAVSGPLLKSIFDPHSIGHDGATIISDNEVTRFGCRLPLSRDFDATANVGTRHAAALGLAELTDALCVVVSEERGAVSVAHDGELKVIQDAKELHARMVQFAARLRPVPARSRLRGLGTRNTWQKLFALTASVVLWLVFAFSAKSIEHTFELPVATRNQPDALEVVSVTPETVSVKISAQIGDLILEGGDSLAVRLDLGSTQHGVNTVRIDTSHVVRPSSFKLVEVEPAVFEVKLADKPEPKKTAVRTLRSGPGGATRSSPDRTEPSLRGAVSPR